MVSQDDAPRRYLESHFLQLLPTGLGLGADRVGGWSEATLSGPTPRASVQEAVVPQEMNPELRDVPEFTQLEALSGCKHPQGDSWNSPPYPLHLPVGCETITGGSLKRPGSRGGAGEGQPAL